jgi:hypothetical protein
MNNKRKKKQKQKQKEHILQRQGGDNCIHILVFINKQISRMFQGGRGAALLGVHPFTQFSCISTGAPEPTLDPALEMRCHSGLLGQPTKLRYR